MCIYIYIYTYIYTYTHTYVYIHIYRKVLSDECLGSKLRVTESMRPL